MALAAKAKLGTIFVNCHKVIQVQHVLQEKGHPLPAPNYNADK